MKVVSVTSVPRSVWGANCSAWELVGTQGLSVKLEEMPPGTAETRHRHAQARQVFFGLSGILQIEVAGEVHQITPETALDVPPGVAHQARNTSEVMARFLVISAPGTAQDREELAPDGAV
ncbi:MAG: cupin domain-containing protein [Roseobacter sp.]